MPPGWLDGNEGDLIEDRASEILRTPPILGTKQVFRRTVLIIVQQDCKRPVRTGPGHIQKAFIKLPKADFYLGPRHCRRTTANPQLYGKVTCWQQHWTSYFAKTLVREALEGSCLHRMEKVTSLRSTSSHNTTSAEQSACYQASANITLVEQASASQDLAWCSAGQAKRQLVLFRAATTAIGIRKRCNYPFDRKACAALRSICTFHMSTSGN